MVTAAVSYDEFNARDTIARWIDHRQRMWDVVNELLVMGIESILHFGPEPNIIPATFERLAANVDTLTRGSRRMRAASAVVRRPWLQNLLPRRAALLRAPLVKHVIVEDWLLAPETRATRDQQSQTANRIQVDARRFVFQEPIQIRQRLALRDGPFRDE